MLSLFFLTFAHAATPENAWAFFPTFQMSPAIGSAFTGPMTQVHADFWWIPVNFETFLVTDNANVPYEPNTELQFDAPSTLQFLFNGAYAERDEY